MLVAILVLAIYLNLFLSRAAASSCCNYNEILIEALRVDFILSFEILGQSGLADNRNLAH